MNLILWFEKYVTISSSAFTLQNNIQYSADRIFVMYNKEVLHSFSLDFYFIHEPADQDDQNI